MQSTQALISTARNDKTPHPYKNRRSVQPERRFAVSTLLKLSKNCDIIEINLSYAINRIRLGGISIMFKRKKVVIDVNSIVYIIMKRKDAEIHVSGGRYM